MLRTGMNDQVDLHSAVLFHVDGSVILRVPLGVAREVSVRYDVLWTCWYSVLCPPGH